MQFFLLSFCTGTLCHSEQLFFVIPSGAEESLVDRSLRFGRDDRNIR